MKIIDFLINNWEIPLGLFMAVLVVIATSDTYREKSRIKNEIENNRDHKKGDYIAKYHREDLVLDYKHLSGLNIPSNAECELWLCKDCLVLYYGAPIVLDYSKMIAAEIFTHKQIIQHYADDTMGAIVGGLAMGIILCGTKVVTETEKSAFLTITYKKGGGTQVIVFDISDRSQSIAKKFAEQIKRKLKYNQADEIRL